jgi:hypothetical protein
MDPTNETPTRSAPVGDVYGRCRSWGSVSDRGDVTKLGTWGISPRRRAEGVASGERANYGGVDGTRGALRAVRLRRVVSVRKFLFGDVWFEEAPRFEHLLAEGVPGTPRAKSNRGQFGTVEPRFAEPEASCPAEQVGVSAQQQRPRRLAAVHQR